MRTTIDIDDDVLQAAKEIAERDKSTAGKVISQLVRRQLTSRPANNLNEKKESFPTLPSRGEVVTLEKVRRIMDAEGI